MRKIAISRFTVATLTVASIYIACEKGLTVETPDFNVSAMNSKVKAGDTVIFNLQGTADIITFYSGEFGNDYAYKDRDSLVPVEALNLSFENTVRNQGGVEPLCQDDQLHVLISNSLDLDDAVSAADSLERIEEADWLDLTDRFVWSPLTCWSTNPYISSGVVDILHNIEKNEETFIAFRYTNRINNPENGKSSIWRFHNLNLVAESGLGEQTILNQSTAGWKPIYEGGTEAWTHNPVTVRSFNRESSGAIAMRGPRDKTETNAMWCLSYPFIITDANLGRNPGVGIKSFGDVPLKEYGHVFVHPGTYRVVFVAMNATKDQRQQILREIAVTVEP